MFMLTSVLMPSTVMARSRRINRYSLENSILNQFLIHKDSEYLPLSNLFHMHECVKDIIGQ